MSEAFGFRKGNGLDGEWCDLEFAGSEGLKAGRFPRQRPRHARHPNAHRISSHSAGRQRAQQRLLRGLEERDRARQDHGCQTSVQARAFSAFSPPSSALPGSISYETGGMAELARRLLRSTIACPGAHRPSALDRSRKAGPSRRDRIGDARQLSFRGEYHRHAQSCAHPLPCARRPAHSAPGRQFACPSDQRALPPRTGDLGRVGYGLDFTPARRWASTTSMYAGSRPMICSIGPPPRSPGTKSAFTSTTRRPVPERHSGTSGGRSPSMVSPVVGGRTRAEPHAGHRSSRSAHALGATLPAGPVSDRASPGTNLRGALAFNHLLRARHECDMDAAGVRRGAGRQIAKQALDLEKGFLP